MFREVLVTTQDISHVGAAAPLPGLYQMQVVKKCFIDLFTRTLELLRRKLNLPGEGKRPNTG